VLKKRNDIKRKRKFEFDKLMIKIQSENIPYEKLSSLQLKTLLMHKKRDDDKISISALKRSGLLALWLEWHSRPDMEINVVLDDEQPQDCIENDTTQ